MGLINIYVVGIMNFFSLFVVVFIVVVVDCLL